MSSIPSNRVNPSDDIFMIHWRDGLGVMFLNHKVFQIAELWNGILGKEQIPTNSPCFPDTTLLSQVWVFLWSAKNIAKWKVVKICWHFYRKLPTIPILGLGMKKINTCNRILSPLCCTPLTPNVYVGINAHRQSMKRIGECRILRE